MCNAMIIIARNAVIKKSTSKSHCKLAGSEYIIIYLNSNNLQIFKKDRICNIKN